MTETAESLGLQLAKLRLARASGVRRIEVRAAGGTRLIEYKTDAQMAAAISDLERRIAAMTAKPIRTFLPFTSKGL